MYTCVWRHLGALDDDFFGLYFMLASILLAAFYSVLLIITGVKYLRNAIKRACVIIIL